MKKFEFRRKQWHEECFGCGVCKHPIGNKRFIPRDNEFVCVPCYEEQFAQRCAKCNGVSSRQSPGLVKRNQEQAVWYCEIRCQSAIKIKITIFIIFMFHNFHKKALSHWMDPAADTCMKSGLFARGLFLHLKIKPTRWWRCNYAQIHQQVVGRSFDLQSRWPICR